MEIGELSNFTIYGNDIPGATSINFHQKYLGNIDAGNPEDWLSFTVPGGIASLRFFVASIESGNNQTATLFNPSDATVTSSTTTNQTTSPVAGIWKIRITGTGHYSMSVDIVGVSHKTEIITSGMREHPPEILTFSTKPERRIVNMTTPYTPLNVNSGYRIAGTVVLDGVPIDNKLVRLHDRKSGAVLEERVTSGGGLYSFETKLNSDDRYYIIAFDGVDIDAVPNLQCIVHDFMIPFEV